MFKKGFTILETLISVVIFSVLMTVVFHCWMEFQKVSVKNEGKQDTNIQFVNVYRDVNKYVSSSSLRYFDCYSLPSSRLREFASDYRLTRWFAFLLSRNSGDTGKTNLGASMTYENVRNDSDPKWVLIYDTVVVYRLFYRQGCCGKFENCPHKILYKYSYVIPELEDNKIFVGKKTHTFANELRENVRQILDNPDITTISGNKVDRSAVEHDLVDFKVKMLDGQVQFYLRLLRKTEAGRVFDFEKKQLTSEDPTAEFVPDDVVKKYIENLSFISIPKNT